MNTSQTHIFKAITVSLALLSVPASAANVFVCDTPTGKVYSDRPCGPGETTKEVRSYNDAVATPSPAESNLYRAQSQVGNNYPLQSARPTQDQVTQEVTVEGYQCSGNGKTWISKKPCQDGTPASMPGFFSGVDQHGRFVSGTGTQSYTAPVDQQALTHEEFCARLQAQMPTNDKGKRGETDSIYERNKQKQLNGC